MFSNGITNRVFRITFKEDVNEEHLVFRVFGKNTEKVIDRQVIFRTIKVLLTEEDIL